MTALDIIISNQSDIPIYQQIVTQMKNLMMNGELSEGDPLPSIRTLATELQISSITTKRAYEELEREGYIVSQVGRGSFVNAQNKELMREKRMKIVEEKLAEAVAAAKMIEMSRDDLRELLDILFGEDMK
ncbi:transcriptional regulator, GntR family [Syntrophobotulus glycolicus DSM 8271]|uniref:Transcriptional regulator, GntR family n=1 Tax=Syntrophobotulus glycolicus (strain DSM 8271 / FlGlyR) TaxID=645991 RepID=F0SYC2_SYNGF|nr:transcriptional regulator, GntR family [Syntrophobotulus glycolicus DSM 8271]